MENPLCPSRSQNFARYTSNDITDAELNSVSPRLQEAMKRYSVTRSNQTNGTRWGGYYTPYSPSRIVRVGECSRFLCQAIQVFKY